jgi:hypothetical protein
MPSKAEWERRIEANPRPDKSAPSSSHCLSYLHEIRQLKDDWDGEGSPAPRIEVIEAAERVMMNFGYHPDDFVAGNNGTIFYEGSNGSIEFLDGSTCEVYKKGELTVRRVSVESMG